MREFRSFLLIDLITNIFGKNGKISININLIYGLNVRNTNYEITVKQKKKKKINSKSNIIPKFGEILIKFTNF